MTQSRAAVCVAAFAVVASLLASTPAFSAPNEGRLDLSFASCGFSSVSPSEPRTGDGNAPATGNAVAVQPDGKIVLAGNRAVGRRLPDGSPDYGFGTNSIAYAPWIGADIAVSHIVVQPDGGIVVAGHKSDFATGMNSAAYFGRYLASGAVDRSFASGGTLILPDLPFVTAVAVQADGKILAAAPQRLMRLLASGAVDATFGTGGVATIPGGVAVDVAVQADGRVVVAVDVTGGDKHDFGVLRLSTNGMPDPTFGMGQLVVVDVDFDHTVGVAVDGTGRIVLAGTSMLTGEGWRRTTLIRRLPDGSADTGFGNDGVAIAQVSPYLQDYVHDLVLTADGRPVVSAEVGRGSAEATVARFTVQGRLDTSFGSGGQTVVFSTPNGPAVTGLARTPDGGLVALNPENGGTVARLRGPSAVAGEFVTAANCTKRVAVFPRKALDFGIPPGRGTPRAYDVTNTGTAPVQVGRIAWVNQGRFIVIRDTCTPAPLAPGSSCQILVTIDPLRGAATGTTHLTIWHNGERAADGAFLYPPEDRPLPVHGMGWNIVGQVGAGPPDASRSPVDVGLPDAVSVAAGWFHTLALRRDGTVWAWGWNAVGQLGDGTTTDRRTPVQVPGLKDVAIVAAGIHSSFAITRDGTVHAWGWNPTGQLGDGTTIDRHRPVRLTALPPMAQISGGVYHTLAVSADHRAWSWGWNGFGALGDGTTVDRLVPQPVPGLGAVTQIAAGAHHSLALTHAGSVTAWGWNAVGQVGDGTTIDRARPTPVQGLGGSVNFIAAGAHHNLAILGYGAVGWGWNAAGQVGDGTTVDRAAPVTVPIPRGGDRVTTVAAGVFHSLATVANGTVWGWGWNGAGQLGMGTYPEVATVPHRVFALKAPVLLSGGYAHSVAG